MNSLAPSNIIKSNQQELPIQPIEILLDKRQLHPHRQYRFQFRNQYNNDIEIIRLPLKHWIIKDNLYNESLSGYFTIQEYTTRIKKFNATSRKLQFYNIMIPLLSSTIFFTILFILVKSFTNKIIYGAALLIMITLAFFNYWFFIRNGRLKTKYLNKLLRKYNKEDVSKNIYWKIIKTNYNRTTQFYLTIELSGLKSSPIYEEKNIPVIVDIHHSNEDSMNKVDNKVDNKMNKVDKVDNNVDTYNVTNVNSMDNVDNLNNVNSVNNCDNNNRLNIKNANNNDSNNDNDNYNYNYNNDNNNDNNNYNYNDDDDDDKNYRHQSNLTINSMRVSVDNAQIHTAIRTELKPPTYYKITGFKRNKVNKVNEVNEVNNGDDDCEFYEFYE